MNKEIHEIIKKHHLHPISYQKIKSVYLVNDEKNGYIIKLNTNNYDIYKYLLSRDFTFFPETFTNINSNYDITLYIKEVITSREQKVNDYIKLLALLHKKTSYMREIDLDEIKKIYEETSQKIISLNDYYHNLNNIIDKELFFSPAMYLLVRNISLIYRILDNGLFLLNELYNEIKNEKSIRVSLIHNNIDLDHLIMGEQNYLISWDKAYFNSPIYDLLSFYQKYYQEMEINDFFKIYENINKLSNIEKKMLIILLAIPQEIKLTNNTMEDTKIINKEINYLNKIYELLIVLKNKK